MADGAACGGHGCHVVRDCSTRLSRESISMVLQDGRGGPVCQRARSAEPEHRHLPELARLLCGGRLVRQSGGRREPLGVCEVGPTRVRTSGSPVAVRDLRLFGTHRSAKVDGHPSVRLMQMDRGGLFATGDRHLTVIRGIGTRLPVAPYRPHPTSSQARSTHRFLDIASTSLGDLKGLYSRNCRGLCCTHPDLLRSHIHPRVVPLHRCDAARRSRCRRIDATALVAAGPRRDCHRIFAATPFLCGHEIRIT